MAWRGEAVGRLGLEMWRLRRETRFEREDGERTGGETEISGLDMRACMAAVERERGFLVDLDADQIERNVSAR